MAMPKIILAGPSERQQYLTHKFNDNSIRFVLNYPGLIQPEALKAAVKQVIESVDILHGTFFTDNLNAYWRINEEVEDIHYFHYVRCAGDPAETAYSVSLFPVFPDDRVQVRVWLIQSEAESSLVAVMSHLAVDGGDGKYLLGKIIEAYNMILEKGNCDELTVKNGSRAPEKVYAQFNTKEIMGMIGMPTSSIKSLYPYPNEEPGMVRYIYKVIPADVMGAARKRAKSIGATANDLLVAALNQAYVQVPGVDPKAPVAVTSMMDLRKHCKDGESEGLCNMSGAMPTELRDGVPETFEETLELITSQTKAMKEDPCAGMIGMPLIHTAIRTAPMGLLLKLAGRIYGNLSLGITNLGNVHCHDFAMGALAPKGGFFGGPVKKKPGMQVAVMSFDGECVLTVCGQFTDEDAQLLETTLKDMVAYIAAYGAE